MLWLKQAQYRHARGRIRLPLWHPSFRVHATSRAVYLWDDARSDARPAAFSRGLAVVFGAFVEREREVRRSIVKQGVPRIEGLR